jgi:hypothetical protein
MFNGWLHCFVRTAPVFLELFVSYVENPYFSVFIPPQIIIMVPENVAYFNYGALQYESSLNSRTF